MIICRKSVYKERRKRFARYPVKTVDNEIVRLQRIFRKREQARIPNVYPSDRDIYSITDKK